MYSRPTCRENLLKAHHLSSKMCLHFWLASMESQVFHIVTHSGPGFSLNDTFEKYFSLLFGDHAANELTITNKQTSMQASP